MLLNTIQQAQKKLYSALSKKKTKQYLSVLCAFYVFKNKKKNDNQSSSPYFSHSSYFREENDFQKHEPNRYFRNVSFYIVKFPKKKKTFQQLHHRIKSMAFFCWLIVMDNDLKIIEANTKYEHSSMRDNLNSLECISKSIINQQFIYTEGIFISKLHPLPC